MRTRDADGKSCSPEPGSCSPAHQIRELALRCVTGRHSRQRPIFAIQRRYRDSSVAGNQVWTLATRSRVERVWSSIIGSLKDDMFHTVEHTRKQNWRMSCSLLSCIDVQVLRIRASQVSRVLRLPQPVVCSELDRPDQQKATSKGRGSTAEGFESGRGDGSARTPIELALSFDGYIRQ